MAADGLRISADVFYDGQQRVGPEAVAVFIQKANDLVEHDEGTALTGLNRSVR